MNKKIKILHDEINKVQKELLKVEEFRPGSLSLQYNVCGSPGCRCKGKYPVKHGPYYKVSYTRKGKGKNLFIKKEEVEIVKNQIENYNKFKKLMDSWIDISIEICQEKIKEYRGKIKSEK